MLEVDLKITYYKNEKRVLKRLQKEFENKTENVFNIYTNYDNKMDHLQSQWLCWKRGF